MARPLRSSMIRTSALLSTASWMASRSPRSRSLFQYLSPQPCERKVNPLSNGGWAGGMGKFRGNAGRNQDLAKKLTQEFRLANRDQVVERRSIRNGEHCLANK